MVQSEQQAGMLSKWWMAIPVIGIVVHLVFLLSLRTGWINALFDDSMHRFGPGGDFFSIYAAGVRARQGMSVYLQGGHVEAVPYGYPFRYAPLVAYTLALGLSFLSAITAYGVWLVLCELALLRNIRLTLDSAPNARAGAIATGMWLCFTPYFLELYVGQFTFLTASLVFWAYMDWRKAASGGKAGAARGRWGDCAWACAVWLKMMPVLFLPLLLLRGRWKGAVLTLVVLFATSVLYLTRFPAD